ncbi:MAG: phosphate signaling complex protein PhoU [Gammaproteobacteria bacterium]|jgi:phosphate transport system protein
MSDHISQYTEGHTVRSFDAEMEQLRTVVLEMGGLVMDQIAQAASAVCDRNRDAVDLVLEREETVNQYDTQGDELIFNLLAKRQPMGADLRVVLSYSRTITDLERCGDEAKKIAKIARRHLDDETDIAQACQESVGNMGGLAAGLLRDAVEALDDADEEKAVKSAKADARLDAEYKVALRNIHATLVSDPEMIEVAADLVIVIKALERIGDHAKNIAKYVVFIVQGKDVRHVKTKVLDKEI